LVAYLHCYGSSLGSNSDISQKYNIGNISKEVAKQKQIFKKKYWGTK
jgi:hypothetical protein